MSDIAKIEFAACSNFETLKYISTKTPQLFLQSSVGRELDYRKSHGPIPPFLGSIVGKMNHKLPKKHVLYSNLLITYQ